MKRMLIPILIVVLSVLSNWHGAICVQTEQVQGSIEASVVTPHDDRHHEATLTDASSLYRVCSSRPQRILPNSFGSKYERTFRLSDLARRYIVKPLKRFHDSRRRLETAPFSLAASCDYYVLALRHIIR